MTRKLNRFSSRITEPKSQGASQAMLYGTGLTDADMAKAEVGIASVWWEGNTCNMHLNDLAAKVKEGVVAAKLVGMRFNTIGADGTGRVVAQALRGLIQGWQDGIPGMKVGGRRQLICPPHLAYGPAGGGHRLSGRTLIFVIDLLDVG